MEEKKKGKVLVIDDNEDILFALNLLLKPLVEDIRVTKQPEQIDRFYDLLHPDVVLLDMNFTRDAISGEEGFEWLEHILHKDAQAVVILMTAYADAEKAVRALKSGATDFITKPWNNSKLLATLFAGIELSQERHKNHVLEQRMEVAASPFGATAAPTIIGESPAMRHVFEMLAQVAPTDANVLILGENGTGKDVIARQLCALSNRAAKTFVSIDLGSVPEQLFEGELFGYEKGAFTDARKAKAGRMETASGGTLFLDEIGNLPLPLQAKLLTALERREISRLGSTQVTPIDVRLICATNADIHTEVAEGRFREDLLYRINTIEITMPPLRERGEDIILLAEHFLKIYARKYNKVVKTLNRDARQRLLRHTWPGNVRELMHAVERAVLLAKSDGLCAQDFMLKESVHRANQTHTLNLERLEQKAIERAMSVAGGNVTRAAELLGITRFALYRKLNK
ncbi:MAG: sigma-54-dependent Fis family transcriptional regulator [Bacteroidaceae bacterium]|nr:sigma-54-dependent Fis family transcriptional regulator [Bacteroidaceae bacterium]